MSKIDRLPEFLADCRWDVEWRRLDVRRYRFFIIERVLDFGSLEGWQSLRRQYTDAEIGEVVRGSRRLIRKTANYWAWLLHIPREQVTSLSSACPSLPEALWRR